MEQRQDEGRRFTEEEVRAIIGRAIERQEAGRRSAMPEDGLTLEEIQRIAAEVGVDPRYVEAAVGDLDAPAAEIHDNVFLAGPIHVETKRRVDGHVPEADVASLIAALREQFPKNRGRVETLAGQVEWHSTDGIGDRISFHVVPEAGHTRLHLRRRFDARAVLWFLPTLLPAVFALIGLTIGGNPQVGLIAAALALVLYGGARFSFRRATRRQHDQLEMLMDRLQAMADEVARPATMQEATAAAWEPAASRLDKDVIDSEVPDTPHVMPHRRAGLRGSSD